MPTVTASKIIIPVKTSAGKANQELAATDKTLKGLTSNIGKYNTTTQKSQTTNKNLANQLKSISFGAKLAGDKTGGLAAQQDLLKKQAQDLIAKGVSPQNKGVKNLVKQYDALGKQVKTTKTSFSSLTKVIGAGAAVALGVKLVNGIKKSIKAGSDLLETNNKFIVTFKGVEAEAEKASKVLQTSYGQSEKGAKSLLSSTGDLLTGFDFTSKAALDLSLQVQKVSTDLSSFQNLEGGAERASNIVTKALIGQRDSLTELGISILDTDIKAKLAEKGMAGLTGTARLQAQAQVTLAMIIDQSKNSYNDFINTSESYANVSRKLEKRAEDLSAKLGSKLAPALATAGSALLKVTEDGSAFSGFIDGFVKDLDVAIKQVANFLNVLNLGSNKVGELVNAVQIDSLNDQFEALNKKAEAFGTEGNLKEFASQLNMGTEEAVSLNIELQNVNKKINDIAEDNLKKNALNKDLIDKITGASEKNAAATEKSKTSVKGLGNATKKTGQLAKDAAENYKDAISILAGTGDLKFKLKELENQFKEQVNTVRKAGLDVTMLEKFQLSQRENLFAEFFASVANNQNTSIDDREAALKQGLDTALSLEKTTASDRLAIQKAYTQQSENLSQEWLTNLANNFEKYSVFATSAIGIGQGFTEFLNNSSLQEIEDLKATAAQRDENAETEEAALEKRIEDLTAAGATAAEIAAAELALDNASTANAEAKTVRDKELADKDLAIRKKQAKQQKIFGIFTTLTDTAIAFTKTLASLPFPANTIAAGLIALEGAAQTAAIASTPIPGAAFGGDFKTPPGNPADGALLRVSQGEDINVKPARKSGQGEGKTMIQIGERAFEGYIVDLMNKNLNSGKVQIRRSGVSKAS